MYKDVSLCLHSAKQVIVSNLSTGSYTTNYSVTLKTAIIHSIPLLDQ